MKLYEFTYIDKLNLNEISVLQRIEAFLVSEALLQGWAPGYKFRPARDPESLKDGSKKLYFEVHGEFVSETGTDFKSEQGQAEGYIEPLAARDAGLQ